MKNQIYFCLKEKKHLIAVCFENALSDLSTDNLICDGSHM